MLKSIDLLLLLAATAWAKTFPSSQQTKLVDAHNEYRSTLLDPKYPAANMMKLEWSSEIETSANEWAKHLASTNNCQMEHPSGEYDYGQNLAIQSGYSYDSRAEELDGMIDVAMEGWGKEEQDKLIPMCEQEGLASKHEFCQGLSTFDHYTQMVWAKTSHIGCAYAFCGSHRLTVCEYGPPGNMAMNNVRQEWYLLGEACSECPSGTTCDESGKLCTANVAPSEPIVEPRVQVPPHESESRVQLRRHESKAPSEPIVEPRPHESESSKVAPSEPIPRVQLRRHEPKAPSEPIVEPRVQVPPYEPKSPKVAPSKPIVEHESESSQIVTQLNQLLAIFLAHLSKIGSPLD